MAQGQRVLCEKLLKIQQKIAPDLLLIDECKDALRKIAEETGEGFTEEVQGLGTVEVKAGREAQLKGTCPEIVTEAYYALTRNRQDKLVEQGLIKIAEQWSKAAKPSVTVRL